MNLSGWIDRHSDFTPDKVAIQCGDQSMTYAEMASDVARLSHALRYRLNVSRGDRIALLAQNSIQSLVLAFACARIGVLFQPLNWRQAAAEHAYTLSDAAPKVLFAEAMFKRTVEEIACDIPAMVFATLQTDETSGWLSLQNLIDEAPKGLEADPGVSLNDSFLLCYTSGTTGRPKGAVLSQNAIFYNAANSQHMHDLSRDDKVFVSIPLFHVGGFNILATPALHAGATVHLTSTFDVDQTFDAVEQHQITLAILVPAQLNALLASPRWKSADLSSLRCISTGSSMVPTSLIERVQKRGIPVIQVYGATETAPLATYQTVETSVESLGSGGKEGLHCEVKVVDDNNRDLSPGQSGEVMVKGPNVLKEYWNDSEATARSLKDGWFHTGDIGHFDDRGFLYIDDRKKDMIISGSENIYPAMLENILADCPGVSEASVVGKKDEKWGEAVVAVVVAEAGFELTQEMVIEHFDGRIGRFARPRQVFFVDSLPRNAMGKVLKDELRALVNSIHKMEGCTSSA